MKRRHHADEWVAHNAVMRTALEQHIKGQARSYGRRHTYSWLRHIGLSPARNRMYELIRELDPEGIASRPFPTEQIMRIDFRVEGPNKILSVDGHHKLSQYGIEIYAGIDAFSRYVNSLYSIKDI